MSSIGLPENINLIKYDNTHHPKVNYSKNHITPDILFVLREQLLLHPINKTPVNPFFV